MQVLGLIGSPRRGGNTDLLMEAVLEEIRGSGLDNTKLYLYDYSIRPCTACDRCLSELEGNCVLDDDMSELYQAVDACQCLIIGTPIYCWGVSGQTKNFLDRLYAMCEKTWTSFRLAGKHIAVVCAHADENGFESGADLVYQQIRRFSEFNKAAFVGMVNASAARRGEVADDTYALARARSFGRKIAAAMKAE